MICNCDKHPRLLGIRWSLKLILALADGTAGGKILDQVKVITVYLGLLVRR